MKTLCESISQLAEQRCPELTPKAEHVCMTFKKVFALFGHCHSAYDSSKALTNIEIDALGKHKRNLKEQL